MRYFRKAKIADIEYKIKYGRELTDEEESIMRDYDEWSNMKEDR